MCQFPPWCITLWFFKGHPREPYPVGFPSLHRGTLAGIHRPWLPPKYSTASPRLKTGPATPRSAWKVDGIPMAGFPARPAMMVGFFCFGFWKEVVGFREKTKKGQCGFLGFLGWKVVVSFYCMSCFVYWRYIVRLHILYMNYVYIYIILSYILVCVWVLMLLGGRATGHKHDTYKDLHLVLGVPFP